MGAHQVMHRRGARGTRRLLPAQMMIKRRIHVIRHAGTGSHLRVIRPGRCEAFVKRIAVKDMPLIGQQLPQGAADAHDALMRAKGLVG